MVDGGLVAGGCWYLPLLVQPGHPSLARAAPPEANLRRSCHAMPTIHGSYMVNSRFMVNSKFLKKSESWWIVVDSGGWWIVVGSGGKWWIVANNGSS